MGLISGITNLVKSAIGTDTLKAQHTGLKQIASSVFSSKQGTHTETFDEALLRLNLTEDILLKRQKDFKRLCIIFGVLGTAIFLYSLYLFAVKAFFPAIGCLGILLIVFGQFFRYHFWLFQIQQRKLGCSVLSWLRHFLPKSKVS